MISVVKRNVRKRETENLQTEIPATVFCKINHLDVIFSEEKDCSINFTVNTEHFRKSFCVSGPGSTGFDTKTFLTLKENS